MLNSIHHHSSHQQGFLWSQPQLVGALGPVACFKMGGGTKVFIRSSANTTGPFSNKISSYLLSLEIIFIDATWLINTSVLLSIIVYNCFHVLAPQVPISSTNASLKTVPSYLSLSTGGYKTPPLLIPVSEKVFYCQRTACHLLSILAIIITLVLKMATHILMHLNPELLRFGKRFTILTWYRQSET